MSAPTREERRAHRIAGLHATDQQFAAARPSEAIAAAINQPGLRLPQLVEMVMEGYAERPALAQRAVQLVTDQGSGRVSVQVLPRFETVTYRELGGKQLPGHIRFQALYRLFGSYRISHSVPLSGPTRGFR